MRRKKEERFWVYIRNTRLQRADLDYILEQFRNNELEIEISDKVFIYDSLDEIVKKRGGQPPYLEFKAINKKTSDWLVLRMSKLSSYIYTSNHPSVDLVGYQIEKYIQKKKRKGLYKWVNSTTATWQIIGFVTTGLILFYFTEKKNTGYSLLVFSGFWVLVLLYSQLDSNSETGIRLDDSNQTSFYSRNKDKILIALIAAIVGAGFSFILTSFIN